MVNNINTSELVLKTQYNTDKVSLENEIPDTSLFFKRQIII